MSTAQPHITPPPQADNRRSRLLTVLHLMVLGAAVALVAYITYDTMINVSFVTNPRYLKVQFWICMFFLLEILLEGILATDKWRFLRHNFMFILVCVPYISIIRHFDIPISGEAAYLLRFVPMIRAAFVMAMMWGIMQKNWITSMFGGYIIMLVATLYFLSLMFYVEETPVNPGVYSYWQSLWYSIMQMTTCGSSVSPVTSTGKVIGVVLSAEGLILFPVFTVYLTKAFAKINAAPAADEAAADVKH